MGSLFNNFIDSLSELVGAYRKLLQTLRQEREVLLTSQMDELARLSEVKEKAIQKIKSLEAKMALVNEAFVKELNLPPGSSLEAIAKCYSGDKHKKILQVRNVLNILVERSHKINQSNESYIKSALQHISGAMQAIKKTLSQNTNYQKAGRKAKDKVETAGRLMSREA